MDSTQDNYLVMNKLKGLDSMVLKKNQSKRLNSSGNNRPITEKNHFKSLVNNNQIKFNINNTNNNTNIENNMNNSLNLNITNLPN